MAVRFQARKKTTPTGVFVTRNGKISFNFKDLEVKSLSNQKNRKLFYDIAWLLWCVHAKIPYDKKKLLDLRAELLRVYFKMGGSEDKKTKVTLTTGTKEFDE